MSKTKQTVRVVCHLPVEINQKLQAQASLDGISKMHLIAEILKDYAKGLKLPRKVTNQE